MHVLLAALAVTIAAGVAVAVDMAEAVAELISFKDPALLCMFAVVSCCIK